MRTCFESAEIKFFQKAERRATPASVASISNHFPRVASINDNARWVVCLSGARCLVGDDLTDRDRCRHNADGLSHSRHTCISLCVCSLSVVRPSGGVYRDR